MIGASTHSDRIGRFEIQDRVRENSFALVYRGRDPFDDRTVEIKICVAADESIRRRFLHAAEEAVRLRHPNITTVFEFGSGESKPYLVQESFADENLSDLMAHGEPIDDVLKLYYLMQIARGLEYAHSQEVLHRELRPAAVLVGESGDVKLADFGVARLASAYAQLGNGAHRWPAVGWLVPELLLGLELDTRSDVYGFGALAFELLSGRPPFPAELLSDLVSQVLKTDPVPVASLWPECPPELDRLILRCMKRDPGRRFENMTEVIGELGGIVPVGDPSDIFEEEKTVVTGELETVYVKESLPQPASPASKTTAEIPRWSTVADRLEKLGGVAASGFATAWTGMRRLSALPGRLSVTMPRLKVLAVSLAVASVLGILGWGVVRGLEPQPATESLPITPPVKAPVIETRANGILTIDAQPWAEVLEVRGEDGESIELSTTGFTPMRLDLPTGRYKVSFQQAGIEEIQSCLAEVRSNLVVACTGGEAAMTTDQFFKETGWWQ